MTRPGLRPFVERATQLALLVGVFLPVVACHRATLHGPTCPVSPAASAWAPWQARDEPGWHGRTIDLGQVQFTARDLTTIAFRTDDEGWFDNRAGQTFHTTDGGRTFAQLDPARSPLAFTRVDDDWQRERTAPYLAGLRWFSEQRGLASVAWPEDRRQESARLLLTEDAGTTWQPFLLPSWMKGSPREVSIETVGQVWWLLQRGGGLARSEDGGRTFLPRKGELTARVPSGGILGIGTQADYFSFLDARQGWAVSLHGFVFKTEDGGDRWVHIGRLPGTTDAKSPHRVVGLLRLNEQAGWIETEGESAAIYFTGDGARSWQKRDVGALDNPARGAVRSVVTIGGGAREVFAEREVRTAEDLVAHPPLVDARRVARWRRGSVVASGGLVFFAGGQPVATWQKGVALSPMRETVQGAERIGPRSLYAWTDHAVARSDDDGASWVRLLRLSGGEFLDSSPANGLLAVKEYGSSMDYSLGLFAEERLLDLFARADRWLDLKFEKIRSARAGISPPSSPLTCLTGAAQGSLVISLTEMSYLLSLGRSSLYLLWDEQQAWYSLYARDSSTPPLAAFEPIERDKMLAFVASLVPLLEPSALVCDGTPRTPDNLALTWTCDGMRILDVMEPQFGRREQRVTLEYMMLREANERPRVAQIRSLVNAFLGRPLR